MIEDSASPCAELGEDEVELPTKDWECSIARGSFAISSLITCP